MAFIHHQSCECVKSELDLFAVPPTQTSVEGGTWVEYNPISALGHGLPIEFTIPGNGQEYIDLANCYVYVSAKITRENGANIDNTDHVGPVNLSLHSLFSEIDIKLNDTLISTTNNTYAYRAYLESLLSFGRDAKKSQLTASMYYKDTAGQMNDANPVAAAPLNVGLRERFNLFRESRTVEMMGKLHGDIFFQDRYLVNDCSLRLRLIRNKDAFCLMSDQPGNNYKMQIISCKMYVRKCRISPSVFVGQAKALEHGNCKYPIRRAVCKTFTIPTGMLNFTQENLFSGQQPIRVIVGFVNNNAFNGAYDANPYNFQHFDLTHMKLYVDGGQGHVNSIEPDYGNERYITAYMSLFKATSKLFQNEGIDISREEYPHGFALYGFTLLPDLDCEDHYQLLKEGNVRLEAKFAVGLPNVVNCVVYAEFENIIELDRSKNVIFDYSN